MNATNNEPAEPLRKSKSEDPLDVHRWPFNEIMDNLYTQLNDRIGNFNSFRLLGKSFLMQHFWNYLKHKYWFWFCACEKWTVLQSSNYFNWTQYS
jgi:hypothetical protein